MFLVMMYKLLAGLMLCQVGAQQLGILDVALNEIPETDDDRLNQALLLVDILKSEYLKLLLRVRSESATKDASMIEQSSSVSVGTLGRSATADSIIWTEKQDGETPVLKPNTLSDTPREQPRPIMMDTAGPLYPWGWPAPGTTVPSRRFYDMMPQPAPAVYPNQFLNQRRNMQPNLPEYYAPKWLNDLPKWLRNAENNLNTENARRSSDTETSNIASENNNATTTTIGESLDKNDTRHTRPTPTAATGNTSLTSTNNTNIQHTVMKKKVPKTTSATTCQKKWPAFLFKSSLRVFLEKSTPLPIPLPENNAFCFTNPRNAMCRSF